MLKKRNLMLRFERKVFKLSRILTHKMGTLEVRVEKPKGIIFDPDIVKMIEANLTAAELLRVDREKITPEASTAVARVAAVSGDKVIYYDVRYFNSSENEINRSALLPNYFLRREDLPPILREKYAGQQ